MATKKISELNTLTTPESDDLIAIVDASATETKKITYGNISKHIVNVGTEVEEDSRVNFIHSDNLFVGTIEQGSITAEGVPSGSNTRIRTKEFINVQPDTTYRIKTKPTNTTLQLYLFEYTNNEVFVQRQPSDWTDASDYIFKTSNTTGKIKIAFRYADNSNLLPSAITSLRVELGIYNEIVVDNEKYTDTIKVGTSIDNRSRVNVLKNKNKVQPNNIYMQSSIDDNNGNLSSGSPTRVCIFQVKVKPNTQYTVSCASGYLLGNIFQYNENKTYTTKVESEYARSKQYTSNSTTQYISFVLRNTDNTTIQTSEINNIKVQVEEGDTETSYEPHIPNQVVVDNEKYTDTINVGQFDGRSRVNVLKSKNLMRIRTIPSTTSNGITYSIDNDGTITLNGTATAQVDIDYLLEQLKTEANISYCLSYIYISGSMTSGRLDIYNQDSNHNWQGYNINIYNEIAQNNKVDLRTYTTDMDMDGARTIRLSNGTVVNNLKFKTMLVKSNVADYDYEPYVVPSIYVDNEEIYTKASNEYSTAEQVIGTWIDGKPLYRRVIKTTTPSTASSTADTIVTLGNISLDTLISIKGIIKYAGTTWRDINAYQSSSLFSFVDVFDDSGIIRIRQCCMGSSYLSKLEYITLEYTKTTD